MGHRLANIRLYRLVIYLFFFSFPSEMNGNEIDTVTDPAVSIATANLQLVLLLEEWRPLCLRHVSMASRIARLMCVFLTGEFYCVLLAWVTCIPRAYPSEHLLPALHIHLAVAVSILKDVRAHCYCASLVRTQFIRHVRATSSISSARIESKLNKV